MIRRRLGLALALGAFTSSIHSQAAPRPQPYCIRGVSLDRAGEKKGTLLLRNGAIEAVLDEAAPTPPGTHVIEGAGLICLPAFLDAFARQGCTVPQPVKDQDLPPNEQADVGVDMRLANRKGIQPGFRAVQGLALTKDQSEVWNRSGFGAALVAPGGELLSGSSALATLRTAAMRDLVMRQDVFAHAAFTASGPGYPSTLMGYFAQLRQFFLDSLRQVELERRYEQGRPGQRPPFDAGLDEGAALVSGRRTLMCEAQSSEDIERWLRLADEFDLTIGINGGGEAWRVTDLLARRSIPVVLTLEWGKEVKDPRPQPEKPAEGKAQEAAAEKDAPENVAEKDIAGKDVAEKQAAEKDAAGEVANPEAKVEEPTAAPQAAEPVWEYDEPYVVRLERRKKWEEARACAVRLQEAGVRFVFGSATGKPSELLEHVRALVKAGLPGDAALTALTHDAAELLGVGKRLGTVAAGYDATFALWRTDPLTDEKASVAWVFVDGFPTEFKEDKKGKKGEGPAEGVDPTGTWQLEFESKENGAKGATLVLEMTKEGSVTGQLTVDSPMDGSKITADVEGQVSKDELELEATLAFGQISVEASLTGKLDQDALDGEGSFRMPGGEAPLTQSFHGKRTPK